VGHHVSRNVTPFRRTLALVVAAMDLPFGYTLTIWSSGAIVIGRYAPGGSSINHAERLGDRRERIPGLVSFPYLGFFRGRRSGHSLTSVRPRAGASSSPLRPSRTWLPQAPARSPPLRQDRDQ
jgi:hypothetical protein